MWTIGYIHYITNKIAYITYSHVDQDIPYQLKCNKGLFHAWDIIAVGLQEHIYNGIANYDIIDIIKIQNFGLSCKSPWMLPPQITRTTPPNSTLLR